MILNDVDVDKAIAAFSEEALESANQLLQVFGCCEELTTHIDEVLKYRRERRIQSFERHKRKELKRAKKKDKETREKMEEMPTLPVIGFCPKCGGKLGGMPMRACEKKKTGRWFYKECQNCTYYSELFKIRNKFIEKEGG